MSYMASYLRNSLLAPKASLFKGILGLLVSSATVSFCQGAITLNYSTTGGGSLTRSSIFNMQVVNPIVISDLSHQIRGGTANVAVRNFSAFFRAGAFDEAIDVLGDGNLTPAHSESSVWTQISVLNNVAQPGLLPDGTNPLLSFPLNLGPSASGTLALDPGLYSFYFHSVSVNPLENANGIRTQTFPLAGDPPIQPISGTPLSSNADVALTSGGSQNALFGGTFNDQRGPGGFEFTYTAVPEPGTVLFLSASGVAVIFLRRRNHPKKH